MCLLCLCLLDGIQIESVVVFGKLTGFCVDYMHLYLNVNIIKSVSLRTFISALNIHWVYQMFGQQNGSVAININPQHAKEMVE